MQAKHTLDVPALEITCLLEALPGYVLLIDDEHRILQANEAVRAIAGKDVKDVLGGYCPKVIHGTDVAWPGCPLEEVAHTGRSTEREVFDEQSGRWLASRISPVRGTTLDGRRMFLHTVTDITAVKRAEHMKDDFIGMVSHELKTPLTVIIGALHTASSPDIPPAESKDLLRDAIDSAMFLAGIVENLLELSRSEGRFKLHTERLDFGSIAWNIAHRLGPQSPKHQLGVDIPARTPDISADKSKVERILINLVENAIKFSPGGGEITIAARPEGKDLRVRVSDNGPGIPEEDQKRLFRSFEQLGTTERKAMAGLGLGLKVCRTLVEAQGGKIWLESTPGKGSDFFFTLPLSP